MSGRRWPSTRYPVGDWPWAHPTELAAGPIGETDGFGELSQLKKEAEGSVECSH
jgi:hypothetical protein